MANKNIFNSIKLNKIKSNNFDLTHDVKMSGKMGNLMPTCSIECAPGDSFNLSCDTMVRFAPMLAPIMHRVDVYQHYFFVPNRILWPSWEEFIAMETTGGIPTITVNAGVTTAQNRFLDYMGVVPFDSAAPVGGTPRAINALPFAAYQCIYNEYYRDQNLVTEVPFALVDGDNDANRAELLEMRRRAYEHDYFTASLPFAQKGAAVDIPLGDVRLKNPWSDVTSQPTFRDDAQASLTGAVSVNVSDEINVGANPNIMAYDPDGTLETTPTTINDLRRAFRLQEFLERLARGGSRYIELIKSMFDVNSSDKRLQRPEYITGTKAPVIISEVLNTTSIAGEEPQGTMAGHGVSIGNGYNGSYYCEEHGYIIGIMSVLPKTAYYQGLPKNYLKTDPLDFMWPIFANIGEQEVMQEEIRAYEATNPVFGYVPRYSEYKYMPSRVAGDFRGNLEFWHMARLFNAVPVLDQTFVECDPEDVAFDKVFAAGTTDDYLWMHVLHKINARRKLPVFGTPMI